MFWGFLEQWGRSGVMAAVAQIQEGFCRQVLAARPAHEAVAGQHGHSEEHV